jgi:putative MATE family efflux protein
MNITYKKGFYYKLMIIALPIAFQNLITSLLNTIDTFMISSLGKTSISGVNQANKLFFLFCLLLFGTSSGSSVFASQYWGKRDVVNIRKVLGICLTIGLVGAVFFSLAAIIFPVQVMRIFTTDKEVIIEGSKYLKIVGISYIFTAITFSYVFILRSTQQVLLPMLISSISICINTFFNWTLIYGNLGMPELGVEGAAIATAGARIFECIALLIIVYWKQLPAAGKLTELFNYNKDYLKNYFDTVLPVITNEVMWALGVMIYSLVYGRMGQEVMSTMAITQTIEQLAFVLFFGLSHASAIMLGNELGGGEEEKAIKYAGKFIKLFLVLSIISSIIVIAFSGVIVDIFNIDYEIKQNIKRCLFVFSLYIPFKSTSLVMIIGILRSGGDTKFTMFLDMGSVWFIGVPCAIVGGLLLKLEIHYVYAMVLFEECVKSIIALKRTYSRKWVKNIVNSSSTNL